MRQQARYNTRMEKNKKDTMTHPNVAETLKQINATTFANRSPEFSIPSTCHAPPIVPGPPAQTTSFLSSPWTIVIGLVIGVGVTMAFMTLWNNWKNKAEEKPKMEAQDVFKQLAKHLVESAQRTGTPFVQQSVPAGAQHTPLPLPPEPKSNPGTLPPPSAPPQPLPPSSVDDDPYCTPLD